MNPNPEALVRLQAPTQDAFDQAVGRKFTARDYPDLIRSFEETCLPSARMRPEEYAVQVNGFARRLLLQAGFVEGKEDFSTLKEETPEDSRLRLQKLHGSTLEGVPTLKKAGSRRLTDEDAQRFNWDGGGGDLPDGTMVNSRFRSEVWRDWYRVISTILKEDGGAAKKRLILFNLSQAERWGLHTLGEIRGISYHELVFSKKFPKTRAAFLKRVFAPDLPGPESE